MKPISVVFDIIAEVIGILSIIIFIGGAVKNCYTYFKTKRYIMTLFMFDSKQCYISQAVYRKEVTSEKFDVVTLASVECFQKIQSLLNKIDYKIIPFTQSYVGENIIHIGGPAANLNVNSLFVTKFKKFIFYTPCGDLNRMKEMGLDLSFVKPSDESTISNVPIRGFKIGEKVLPITNQEDYGIFIRIPKCEEEGIEYTTHIIFGGWAQGTVSAVEFFTRNYKLIAKKYNKSRYCFAVPINRVNNSTELIGINQIIDLTNDFFK